MSKQQTSFSFPSFRRLCKYLGEADALIELTELAARSFILAAVASGDAGRFTEEASRKFGVRVNLSEVSQLNAHLYRHYIVTVYQSAEHFLHDFRQEHIGLYGRGWTGDADNIDPLTVTFRNICDGESDPEKAIGQDLITRFQYYRSVRNWAVHTKDEDDSKPRARFREIEPYSDENGKKYASVNAPHEPDMLNFEDFILFSRITKQIGECICKIAKPTESDEWLRALGDASKRFSRLKTKPERMINSIAGKLRTEYGIDGVTSRWVAEEIHRSL
jgi:hypothetical protein